MAASNEFTALLFCVLILVFKLRHCVGENPIFCPQIEKQSLLNFKQSLIHQTYEVSSWDSEVNCCKWEGVVCNNLTGHVHQLHLQNNRFPLAGLSGEINSSLVNLTRLRYLDLSLNMFPQAIPSFFGSFTNLEYLNLSMAGFYGKIPHTIGNLSNLHTLDLTTIPVVIFNTPGVFNQLNADKLEWLSGLSKLEYLNMNGADLRNANNWPQVINTLSSLLHLHLRQCNLQLVDSLNHVNTTSLKSLDLSNNNYGSSPVPTWIFRLSNLHFLDISSNYMVGPIPSISNITKLQYIDLEGNRFDSSIPDWLFLCTNLSFVSLGSNHLSGELPIEIGNLEALEELSLIENQLSGELPDVFGELKSLRVLELRGNSFSGAIPISLGKLASLEVLDLLENKFSGNLPQSIGQLSKLRHFSIEGNMLEGVVSESHLANLTTLEIFEASRNQLSLKVGANWIPPFQLRHLELSGWNQSTTFDQSLSWLQTQKGLDTLDLSNSRISGSIPLWIYDIHASYINISNNNLQGKIPYIPAGAQLVFLSSNQLSGVLPQIPDDMLALDLSDNSFSGGLSHFLCNGTRSMVVLHLRGNLLDGELPDCWMHWPSLRYLNLGDNMISGRIPTSLAYLNLLRSLNLYGNKFSGQIPFSRGNYTQLLKMDLSHNDLHGHIPTSLWTTPSELKFLILDSNKLSGEISPKICHLNALQVLDLSHNRFSGTIPICVNNFTAMSTKRSVDGSLTYLSSGMLTESARIATKGRELQYDTILYLMTSIDLSNNSLYGEIPKELTSLVELRTLNLSQNHFTGSIPDTIGDMKQLESLDVSTNSLSGPIPDSITLISSLSYLNLSYNNLTGKIPDSTQVRGFDASSFIGTNLCGPPLPRSCSPDGDEEAPQPGSEDEDGSAEIEWVYVFLSMGFAVGVSIVCSAMALKKSWREAYYGWLESIWDKIYVFVCVHWRRLKFHNGNQNLS